MSLVIVGRVCCVNKKSLYPYRAVSRHPLDLRSRARLGEQTSELGKNQAGSLASCKSARREDRPLVNPTHGRPVGCDAHMFSKARAHPPARRSHAHACGDVQPWRPREPHCELRHALHTARTRPPETRTCARPRPIAPSRTHARCSHRVDAQTAHGRCWRRRGSGVGGERRRRSRYARILTRRPAQNWALPQHRLPKTHARATPRPSRTSSRES